MPANVECPDQVDRHHPGKVVQLVRQVLVEVVSLEGHADASAVDGGVQLAKLIDGGVEGSLDIFLLGNV